MAIDLHTERMDRIADGMQSIEHSRLYGLAASECNGAEGWHVRPHDEVIVDTVSDDTGEWYETELTVTFRSRERCAYEAEYWLGVLIVAYGEALCAAAKGGK